MNKTDLIDLNGTYANIPERKQCANGEFKRDTAL